MTARNSQQTYPSTLCEFGHESSADVLHAVQYAAIAELQACLDVFRHCLHQLSAEQVWSRPSPEQNAIGNLLLHLAGNLRQWVIVGLSGGPDQRRREQEFVERTPIEPEQLMDQLTATVIAAVTAIDSVPDAAEWLRPRIIQGFAVHGVAALLHSVAHFRGHTQEIVGRTRQLLGPEYQFAWSPLVRE